MEEDVLGGILSAEIDDPVFISAGERMPGEIPSLLPFTVIEP